MSIEDRLTETGERFENVKAKREEQLQIADAANTQAKEYWDEMMRIQGEYRVLQELVGTKASKTNKKATTIEAVPEETK